MRAAQLEAGAWLDVDALLALRGPTVLVSGAVCALAASGVVLLSGPRQTARRAAALRDWRACWHASRCRSRCVPRRGRARRR